MVLRRPEASAAARRRRRRRAPRRGHHEGRHLRGHASRFLRGEAPPGRHGRQPHSRRRCASRPSPASAARPSPRRRTRSSACSASRPTTTGWSTSGAPSPAAGSSRSCLIPLWDAELAAAEVRRNAERGRAGRLLQRDPAVPRAAVGARPRPLLGPVLPGLRRDRHRRQHAHRLVVEDAVDVGRRPSGGGLDPDAHQRHLLGGRLPVLRRPRPLPRR